MKEITIVSGKGGTGKTSITAALASVAEDTVFCDNDVDASDLHLIFKPEIKQQEVFVSGVVAEIQEENCTNCGVCKSHCRFGAIHYKEGGGFSINPFQCEGCRLCERVCPANAIHTTERNDNQWFISDSRFGPLVHAKMGPGEENSGKLVSLLRDEARKIAQARNARFILNDGPPGIGCTTISALSGTHRVLLVIEPSRSAIHDAKRLIELVQSFDIEMYAIINKCDMDELLCLKLEAYLQSKNIPLIDKLPFDKRFVEAMVEGKTIVEYQPNAVISHKIQKIWERLTVGLEVKSTFIEI